MHTRILFITTNLLRGITAAILSLAVLPAAFSAPESNAGQIHDLGVQYINGDSVTADAAKGRNYIHQSALMHFPLAQYHLGILFYTGQGGDQNTSCARWWLGKSALTGGEINILAQQALADIYQDIADNPDEKILLTRPTDIAQCEKLPESAITKAAVQTVQQVLSAAESVPVVPPFLTQITRFTRFADNLTTQLATQSSLQWTALTAAPVKQESPVPDDIIITIIRPVKEQEITETALTSEPPATIYPTETIHLSETTIPERIVSNAEQDNAVKAPARPPKARAVSRNTGQSPRTAPGHHYTIQLGSAATPDGLYHSARRYKLSNYLVYETVRHGRQWYVLVYGDYPDLSSAKSALRSLPSAFYKDKPWVRSQKQVQPELL